MAIKDKDGKVYKLRGPNPLVKNQVEWDRHKLKLINLSWQNEVVEDAKNPVKAFDETLVKIDEELDLKPNAEANVAVIEPQQFIEEIQAEPVPELEPEPIPEPQAKPEPKVIEANKKIARIFRERGAEFFCAPVIGKRTHLDDLYGHSYDTLQYGDKFVFDAVVLDQSDLETQFWCMRQLSIGSIIYRKERGERWWRIKDIEPKSGGYIVTSIISDTNPDFS